MESDPLDELFELEDTYYKEGYDLGMQDGNRAGQIEGRLFGLEKGFEKYAAMGRLHGRSVIWAERLSTPQADLERSSIYQDGETPLTTTSTHQQHREDGKVAPDRSSSLSPIPHNPRLVKHIRTLYALTEPASLSTDNTEDAVSDFDDRLKRAEGKVKIIEKSVGEAPLNDNQPSTGYSVGQQPPTKGDGGIEDMSHLPARR